MIWVINRAVNKHIRGSEFSSYEIVLRNRVTQNQITLRVTYSMVQLLFFYFRVTNSKLKN